MILVTECASGDTRTPSRSPPSSERQLSCAASALVETPLLHGRPFSPALSYAPQREPLLCTHIPSPPPEEGGINMLRLGAQRARSGELSTRVGVGPPDRGVPGTEAPCPPPTPEGWGGGLFALREGRQLRSHGKRGGRQGHRDRAETAWETRGATGVSAAGPT